MRKIFYITLLVWCSTAKAQIPVELMGGHEKATVDIMFFKYFQNKQGENSLWLFFNRNRASVDYRMTETTYLPQFGFTEAISYNHEKLKGFAPVWVGQVLSWGVYSKAGIQYAHVKKKVTIFTWLVCETNANPNLDYFLLFRYTPQLTDKVALFTQVESINTFPTVSTANHQFAQRFRLGISKNHFQLGAAADLNQTGNDLFVSSYNAGIFIRHEF